MPTSLTIHLVNTSPTPHIPIHAYITGLAIPSMARVFIQSDGRTTYFPPSPPPGKILQPFPVDCAIPVPPGPHPTVVTIPRIAGGRIWFCQGDKKLKFMLNPGGPGGGAALVEPSVLNPSDPNRDVDFAFCEFTLNDHQLFANISYVDFVPRLPIALTLVEKGTRRLQHVSGMRPDGLERIAQGLRDQAARDGWPWDKLVVHRPGMDRPLRVLAPTHSDAVGAKFDGYFEPLVDRVWERYCHFGKPCKGGHGAVFNTDKPPGPPPGPRPGDAPGDRPPGPPPGPRPGDGPNGAPPRFGLRHVLQKFHGHHHHSHNGHAAAPQQPYYYPGQQQPYYYQGQQQPYYYPGQQPYTPPPPPPPPQVQHQTHHLRINTQAAPGILTGHIPNLPSDPLLVGSEPFHRPTTADIFGCNSGPFTTGPNAVRNAIIPRLAAAFQRSSIIDCEDQPSDVETFYRWHVDGRPTNHYARVVHEWNADGKGYAFAYDDVQRDGGRDQSGKVEGGQVEVWVVEVGGGNIWVG
ncbi:hypothetical protein NEUTE1DRAFT_144306 [Neurospora tetrasperma FGSC 2508]|uniref:GH64 domain-containing protein n=1 Tax=Neurospora tetrasperma (strain FGSC 2508 / ATCC MYA-4615 / P0657) TaxID=510951 RepID=F8MAS3_NEUT8|nr:uncharacterized protein NEUTE1DRAFT_144306 [Neurospora tetrasperma FGSC 2508]EGO60996.1 hypothetical protein NEUTE1DRAFT_144306 [Neurospora tetrasperma FGSC 2508]EGZ74999.1 hypothetical protein NEUTE2DRAFT_148253 [Neurospora tetrasperma FGSC 2509]